MIKPIFEITKDNYKMYDPSNDGHTFIVNDDLTYLQSRVQIEKIKLEGFVKTIKVVIQNKNYFKHYKDIEELEDLAVVEFINPMDVFSKEFDYQIPTSITSQFLIDNLALEEIGYFNNHYNSKFDFEINLLLYKLELDGLDQLSTLGNLLNFLMENQEKSEELKDNSSLFILFDDRILAKLEDEFLVDDLKEAITSDSLNSYFDFLISTYILSHYKKHHFNRFISDFNFNYDNLNLYYKLAQDKDLNFFYNKLYLKRSSYTKKINSYLKGEEGKIDIFAGQFEHSKYLDNISGYLEYELEYIAKIILKDLSNNGIKNYHLPLVAKIEGKFGPLFKFEKIKAKFNRFKELFKSIDNLEKNKDIADSFSGWSQFYREEYLNLNNRLEEDKDIFNIISTLSEEYDLNLIKIKIALEDKIHKFNVEYEDFLINNYPSLLKGNLAIYSRLEDVKEIIGRGQPVIMIVIDAMRWSIWEIISGIFEKYGFTVINQGQEASLSLIPSVTNISRHSLFAGLSYDVLQKKKLAEEFTHSISNEEKNLKRYFSHNKVSFSRGGKNDFKKLLSKEADLYSFVFTEADEMFHGFRDINRTLIEALFESQIRNITDTIDCHDYLARAKVVVTTDHGTVHIAEHQSHSLGSGLKRYLDDNDLHISSHGRYLKIWGDDFNGEVYEQIKKHISDNEEDYWHIINRDKMPHYFLPTVDNNGDNYLWLISKYGYYSGSCRGEYAHGGLSLTETIIPFAVLEKKERIFIAPEIKLIESDLTHQKRSVLELLLINNNNYPLRDITIYFKRFGITERKSIVKSDDVAQIKVNLLPAESGDLDEEVRITFSFAGERREEIKRISLTVKDSSKSRIDKSLRKSRDLF